MNALTNQDVGEIWAEHYRRRKERSSWLLLTSIKNILMSRSLIRSRTEVNPFDEVLRECGVPKVEFLIFQKESEVAGIEASFTLSRRRSPPGAGISPTDR